MKTIKLVSHVFAFLLFAAISSLAQEPPTAPQNAPAIPGGPVGSVEHITVRGKSLEGNLEGDSPDRAVSVYLPPSYAKSPHRRYPVVYFFHGYTDSDDKWYGPIKHWINLPTVVNKALAEPGNREIIFVTPNAFTRYQGSFYSNSITTGNWEGYIVNELIPYIDAHYRTIPTRASRGLAGHSMGGYGAMRIAMRHPETFSSFYLLSACCMALPGSLLTANGPKAEAAKTFEDVKALEFLPSLLFALSAAWAPDPKNPPFYLDLPTKDGKLVDEVVAKYHANEPLHMIDQYIVNLRRYKAIGFDAGDKDHSITLATRDLDAVLTSYSIPHQFEIYDGDHLNHIADRIETKLVPFFSQNLSFDHSVERKPTPKK
jgi:enterochelin esterase-like enzyme